MTEKTQLLDKGQRAEMALQYISEKLDEMEQEAVQVFKDSAALDVETLQTSNLMIGAIGMLRQKLRVDVKIADRVRKEMKEDDEREQSD